MNLLQTVSSVSIALAICCLALLAQAGGDKSAKTTVITLAGGGDKAHGGYPIPIPIPVCTGGHGRGYGGGGGGAGHGHGGMHSHSHHHASYGAQARMGWRR